MTESRRLEYFLLGVALIIRVLATIAAALKITPYSRDDPTAYADAAAFIAQSIQSGNFAMPPVSYVVRIWGLFLSPFWLFPGPSAEYARLANAVLGVVTVYNVYFISTKYHSRRAGFVAALPMALFPTHFLLHGTLMRDTAIIFGITTAVRLFVAPPITISRERRYFLAASAIGLAIVLRPDNLPIYGISLLVGIVIWLLDQDYITLHIPYLTTVSIILVTFLSLPIIQDSLEYLASIRSSRAHEDAVYLSTVTPETISHAVSVGWILALYFLYTPFPWMIASFGGIVVFTETLVSIGYTIAAIYGARRLCQNYPRTAIPLVFGFLVGIVLYGLGTANYGAATRFRQMFTWLLFVFGGVGIAMKFQLRTHYSK